MLGENERYRAGDLRRCLRCSVEQHATNAAAVRTLIGGEIGGRRRVTFDPMQEIVVTLTRRIAARRKQRWTGIRIRCGRFAGDCAVAGTDVVIGNGGRSNCDYAGICCGEVTLVSVRILTEFVTVCGYDRHVARDREFDGCLFSIVGAARCART